MAVGLVEGKLMGLLWYQCWIFFLPLFLFSLFSQDHHCSASCGLRVVDPHHVVRYLILLLVDNSYTNSSNKLTQKSCSEKRAKRGGEAVIYRL